MTFWKGAKGTPDDMGKVSLYLARHFTHTQWHTQTPWHTHAQSRKRTRAHAPTRMYTLFEAHMHVYTHKYTRTHTRILWLRSFLLPNYLLPISSKANRTISAKANTNTNTQTHTHTLTCTDWDQFNCPTFSLPMILSPFRSHSQTATARYYFAVSGWWQSARWWWHRWWWWPLGGLFMCTCILAFAFIHALGM